jgi:hypothetical protein
MMKGNEGSTISVVVGVTSLGDPSRLGLIGGATILYYLSTMLIAVVLGAVLVTTFQPGVGLDPKIVAQLQERGQEDYREREELFVEAEEMGLGGVWMNIVEQMIPTNIIAEMSATRPLGVIVFALLFGLALAATGEKGRPAVAFFEARGRKPYLLLEMWEQRAFRERFAADPLGSLEWPPMVYVGRISYGLFLWQFIVLYLWRDFTGQDPFSGSTLLDLPPVVAGGLRGVVQGRHDLDAGVTHQHVDATPGGNDFGDTAGNTHERNIDKAAESDALTSFVDYYMSDDGLATSVEESQYVPLSEDRLDATRRAWEEAEPAD